MTQENRPEKAPVDHGEVVHPSPLRISWAWIFPVLAIAATVWLFWSNLASRGPEVEIAFDTAPGMQAGKTPLIYRGVTAGKVTRLRLDASLAKVLVTVRLEAFAAELAREGTVFWIDQPVVGIGGTSGLDALIQGNSLQARMGSGPPAYQFTGVDEVPLTPLEAPALTLQLRAADIPFVDRGSPLFYRGVAVGEVESKVLDAKGQPSLHVVIDAKFAHAVRSNVRFWPVPATSLKVGAGGVKVDILGLKAVLLGGIEFEAFGDPGGPVADGAEFTLYPDRFAARATGEPVRISFKSGTGIVAGQTEVRHLGVPVGFVESAELNPAAREVDAIVRFLPEFAHLHDADAIFTLIRPRISLEGISGLETIVGGPYIDCSPGGSGQTATRFAGRTLGNDGFETAETEGKSRLVIVHADTLPPVAAGAPVFYRGLVAGQVREPALGADGKPELHLIIRPEFARAVTGNTRFWNIPPASVQAGPGVLQVDVANLESLAMGALAFDAFGPAAESVPDGARFALYESRTAAQATSPPIRILFENGQGLLGGQTQVRYLGLPVGLVESATPRNGKVEAIVRLDAGYDFLRREGSAFSIVRLNVSLNGVAGLETLVSGVYVECVPAAAGRLIDRFTGVSSDKADAEEAEESGFEIVVIAPHTNVPEGAPVTYRGLVVGKIVRKELAADGREVGLRAVINEEHASLLRENTKFWDAGGVKISLGPLSFKVQTTTLDALTHSGIAFATPDNPFMGPPVERGHEFTLHGSPRREWLRWAPRISQQK
ncbi:MAG TPA: MlaD family protein [Terrimicrobiaceae bacterium]|nr:MlaD family protein [Terrimicrobiaceae bacterium]